MIDTISDMVWLGIVIALLLVFWPAALVVAVLLVAVSIREAS